AGKPATFPTFGQLRVGDGHVVYDDAILPAHIDARLALNDGSDLAEASALSNATPSGGASAASGAMASASEAARSASSPDGSKAGIVVRAGRPAAPASALAERVTLDPGQVGLSLKAVGSYRNLPLRIDLRTDGVLRLFLAGSEAKAQPLRLLASIGRADLSFEGSTTDPLHFAALRGRFTLAGPSLAAVGDPLGVTLPTTPAFKTHGTLAKDGAVWNAVFESASVGSSRLTGAFTYDTRPKVPLLSGRLAGARLVLADLGPAVGTPPSGAPVSTRDDRVIPDKKFDLPSLRAMDANVIVDIDMFDPGTALIEPLRPVRAHILLADGVLTIADFEGDTADGRLVGYLQLDGRKSEALWTADMRAVGLDLSKWLRLKRKGDAPPYVSGRLDAMVKVKGQGRSTAEILSTLNGDIRAHLRKAEISHLAIEVAGLDVAQALGVFVKGDDALPVLCNVADLDVANGLVTPRVFVIDTKDSTIWIDGTISLKTEGLDLKAVVSPKDFSPLTLRTPIRVTGVFGKPKVSLDLGKLAGKTGAAALLALLNPLAAIIPFIDPGSRGTARHEDEECANLVKTRGVISRATRTPANVRVPAAAIRGATPASSASSAGR
ncbi:MAG TPA: AsmA-like C-terminal region-containing protein, partial [Caldimonas sp.]|nr:AsmA-like C-terminal region-containing protein [Caldimonas sp.]